ncbi:hypothetical protein JKP88DRAFT_262841 [Tribonema minus]|uniref:EamA domain-containing protein n=1 Tax=Tribonema minus TaxID=303371 RepID=A0A835Z6R7_9STRA|nr:hypothetical protein JKP88DRAFT_262841 [Tribonema minus]
MKASAAAALVLLQSLPAHGFTLPAAHSTQPAIFTPVRVLGGGHRNHLDASVARHGGSFRVVTQRPYSVTPLRAAAADNDVAPPDTSQAYITSLATLMICVWCWALQTPLVRYCFNTVEHPPPIAVLNAGSAAAALLTVLGAAALQAAQQQRQQQQQRASGLSADAAYDDATAGPSFLRDTEAQRAGLELGTYKFMGVGLNLLGISLTLSSQAAFCIQLTTIMVPLAQAAMGVRLKPQLWAAVAMAFGGVGLLTLDGATNVGGANLHNLLLGDAYCVAAAGFYAAYDVRVNAWSKRARTLPLTLYKTGFQTLYSVAAVAALVASGTPQGQQVLDWAAQVTPDEARLIAGVAIFSGGAANGIATLLQVGAQRQVGPSRAQLIYSTNPLWNSLIATLVLGETIRTVGVAGAGLFLSALAIAAVTPPESEDPAVAAVTAVKADDYAAFGLPDDDFDGYLSDVEDEEGVALAAAARARKE